MFTYNNPNYDWLDQITRPTKLAYCQRWGLDLIHEHYHGNMDDIGWHKVDLTRRLLQQYEGVLYVECDALILNQELDPNRIVKSQDGIEFPFLESPHLTLTTDFNGCNLGVFYIRNSAEMQQYLDTIWNVGKWLYGGHGYHEQKAFEHFANVHPYRNLVHWVPQRTMNSYIFHPGTPWYRPGRYQKGDWIVHLAGTGNDDRRRFAECLMRGENPGG